MTSPGTQLRLLEWKPIRKNALRGFATVELPSGLTIVDVTVLVGSNGAWASLPSKPRLSSDGTAHRGDDGRILYVPILRWRSRELQDGFSAAVVAAVEAQHGRLS